MELDTIKQRTDVILSKKALNDLCRIMIDSGSEKIKLRGFLCPCGYVSTEEYEENNKFRIISKNCDL